MSIIRRHAFTGLKQRDKINMGWELSGDIFIRSRLSAVCLRMCRVRRAPSLTAVPLPAHQEESLRYQQQLGEQTERLCRAEQDLEERERQVEEQRRLLRGMEAESANLKEKVKASEEQLLEMRAYKEGQCGKNKRSGHPLLGLGLGWGTRILGSRSYTFWKKAFHILRYSICMNWLIFRTIFIKSIIGSNFYNGTFIIVCL